MSETTAPVTKQLPAVLIRNISPRTDIRARCMPSGEEYAFSRAPMQINNPDDLAWFLNGPQANLFSIVIDLRPYSAKTWGQHQNQIKKALAWAYQNNIPFASPEAEDKFKSMLKKGE